MPKQLTFQLSVRSCVHWLALGVVSIVVTLGCAEREGDSADSADVDAGGPPVCADVEGCAEATAVANDDTNACAVIRPFYWEIGDRDGLKVGGSVNADDDATLVDADTVMGIASASKWLYASYVVERNAGVVTDDDLRHLRLMSGYTSFGLCLRRQTVGECAQFNDNGVYTAENDGLFYYGGGHMQQHAVALGLSDMDTAAMADEIRSQIGSEIDLTYSLPEFAGGAWTSPAQYAKFLRKILAGDLRMRSLLGTNPVCASPTTCPRQALSTAVPSNETWHYSLGHWIEDDPQVGDGAFSSLGVFGFYPWIDRTTTWYGIVAMHDLKDVVESVQCGRLIREAWVASASP